MNPLETVLFTAARNSSALTCRTRWRVLETAAVYTDYVPNAKKIIFSADTPDTVSDLPPASSALGTFTLPKTVPKRAGFEVSVLPGEQIEIYADTTFYAVWKSSYKISLSPITFRNNSFESHPNVPDGDFWTCALFNENIKEYTHNLWYNQRYNCNVYWNIPVLMLK